MNIRNLKKVFATGLATVAGVAVLGWSAAWAGNVQPGLLTDDAMQPRMTRGIGPQAPHSKALAAAPKWAKFQVSIKTDKKSYCIGDQMAVTITTNRDCYIMVSYLSTDGKTCILCPSSFCSRNHILAGKPFSLVSNDGKHMVQYGPAGTETLQVLATEKPLDPSKMTKIQAKPHVVVAVKSQPSVQPAVKDNAEPAQENNPQYDEYGNPVYNKAGGNSTAEAAPSSSNALAVNDAQAFSHNTETLVRGLVLDRSKEIEHKYRSIGPSTGFRKEDSVYGLASVRYTVVGKKATSKKK